VRVISDDATMVADDERTRGATYLVAQGTFLQRPRDASGVNREGERKRTIVEVSKLRADIRTRGHNYPWDEPIGSLLIGWAVSGIEMARARFSRSGGTAGTRIVMRREPAK
jgi:hypothetical protein